MDAVKKSRRRSSRGRRSMVTMGGESPTSVPVLSASICGLEDTDILGKMNDLTKYMESVDEECQVWATLLHRYNEIKSGDPKVDMKRPHKRASVADVTPTPGLRPKYLLSRVEKVFFDRYTECNKQKDIDNLTEKKVIALQDLKLYNRGTEIIEDLYRNQCPEKLEEEENAWKCLLAKTQKHLDNLTVRESFVKAF